MHFLESSNLIINLMNRDSRFFIELSGKWKLSLQKFLSDIYRSKL